MDHHVDVEVPLKPLRRQSAAHGMLQLLACAREDAHKKPHGPAGPAPRAKQAEESASCKDDAENTVDHGRTVEKLFVGRAALPEPVNGMLLRRLQLSF